MLIELSEEELNVIRMGLKELPIKVALNTLINLDDKIIKATKPAMAVPEGQ